MSFRLIRYHIFLIKSRPFFQIIKYNIQQMDALSKAPYTSEFLDTILGTNVGGALNMAVVELLTGNTDAAGIVQAMTDAAAKG